MVTQLQVSFVTMPIHLLLLLCWIGWWSCKVCLAESCTNHHRSLTTCWCSTAVCIHSAWELQPLIFHPYFNSLFLPGSEFGCGALGHGKSRTFWKNLLPVGAKSLPPGFTSNLISCAAIKSQEPTSDPAPPCFLIKDW